MANVLVISSSFRKNSNSTALAGQIAKGAKEAGHEVTRLNVADLDVKPCRGCEACHAPGAKGCVQRDEMDKAYPLLDAADIIIFASPIYWFNMCGQLKVFIDRLLAIVYKKDAEGNLLFAAKKIGAALTYGDEDHFASGCMNAIRCFQDICLYTGAQWLGPVYGSAYDAGEIQKNEKLMADALEYGKKL